MTLHRKGLIYVFPAPGTESHVPNSVGEYLIFVVVWLPFNENTMAATRTIEN